MSRLRWPDSTNSVSEKPGTIQLGHPPQLRLPRKSRKSNGVVERWNRTLKEQAVYGRGFLNLADVRAAVAEFVERYNQ